MRIIAGLVTAVLLAATASGCASPYDYRYSAYDSGSYYRGGDYPSSYYYPPSYYVPGGHYPRGYIAFVY